MEIGKVWIKLDIKWNRIAKWYIIHGCSIWTETSSQLSIFLIIIQLMLSSYRDTLRWMALNRLQWYFTLRGNDAFILISFHISNKKIEFNKTNKNSNIYDIWPAQYTARMRDLWCDIKYTKIFKTWFFRKMYLT